MKKKQRRYKLAQEKYDAKRKAATAAYNEYMQLWDRYLVLDKDADAAYDEMQAAWDDIISEDGAPS